MQKGIREIWKCQNITKFQWRCFIRTGLCWMGFWWSSLWQFPSFFWIIICHRSISILEFFLFGMYIFCCMSCTLSTFLFICILLFVLHLFYGFFLYVYISLWISLMNQTLLAFCLANKKCKKILMEQNDILWNLQHFIFWKDKINYNKTIMSTQNNLIIVLGSAKQYKTQICKIIGSYCPMVYYHINKMLFTISYCP